MREHEANEVLAYFIYGSGITISVISGVKDPIDILGFLAGIVLIGVGSLLIHRTKRSKFWFFR
jgi:maltodextrin utilization protein YvdJ